MKYLAIILLFLVSCKSPVERVGDDKPTDGLKKEPVEVVDTPTEPDGFEDGIKDGFPDDWVLIKAFQGEWAMIGDDGTKDHDEYCVYEFHYSKSRGKFELRTEGYRPKNHSMYERMSKAMGNINKAQLKGTHTDLEIIEDLQTPDKNE